MGVLRTPIINGNAGHKLLKQMHFIDRIVLAIKH